MANDASFPPSFSAGRRWGLFFSVMISIVAVVALVVMANYLGARYFLRLKLNRQSDFQLSLRTVALLKSITNQVNVVIYYDKGDNLYSSVASLLDEYRLTNPKISVRTVDYLFNASEAQKVKAAYKLGAGQEKNVIIFECEGRQEIALGSELGKYTYGEDGSGKPMNLEKRLNAFDGEHIFSSKLLNVTNPKPRKAYFVQGHGEHSLESISSDGYEKFGLLLEETGVTPGVAPLFGTNNIPADCNLLIIAGPRELIPAPELEKIKKYLADGGRLLALFRFEAKNTPTGLEALLAAWNVKVGMNVVTDPPDTQSGGGLEVMFFNHNHPLSQQLINSSLVMVNPRSIEPLSMMKQGPESPKVTTLAETGNAGAVDGFPVGGAVSLVVAVEKEGIQGVLSENTSTAMVVVGDSLILDNQFIEAGANRDFGAITINWLVDQRQLIKGIGPHPVKEYKLMMTAGQMKSVDWIFLGAMPGGVLALGILVWFRRRR